MKINGVYIKAKNEVDALIATIYCYKKFAHDSDSGFRSESSELDDDFDEEFDFYEQQWSEDDTYCYLPIVTGTEFTSHYFNMNHPFANDNSYLQLNQVISDEYSSLLEQHSKPTHY